MWIGLQYFAGRRRSRLCWQITNNTLLLFRLQVVGKDDGGGDGSEGIQQITRSQTSSFD
jgi:hypothetical protein